MKSYWTPGMRVSLRTLLILTCAIPVLVWITWNRFKRFPGISATSLSRSYADPDVEGTMVNTVFADKGLYAVVQFIVVRVKGDATTMGTCQGCNGPLGDRGISIAGSKIFVDGKLYQPRITSGFLIWNPADAKFDEVPDDFGVGPIRSGREIVQRGAWKESVAERIRAIRKQLLESGDVMF